MKSRSRWPERRVLEGRPWMVTDDDLCGWVMKTRTRTRTGSRRGKRKGAACPIMGEGSTADLTTAYDSHAFSLFSERFAGHFGLQAASLVPVRLWPCSMHWQPGPGWPLSLPCVLLVKVVQPSELSLSFRATFDTRAFPIQRYDALGHF